MINVVAAWKKIKCILQFKVTFKGDKWKTTCLFYQLTSLSQTAEETKMQRDTASARATKISRKKNQGRK